VPVFVSSALPVPPVASYVVSVNVSLPSGDGGPETVHPLLHVAPLMFDVAGLPVSAPGGDPFTSVSVIVIERTDGEMYCGFALFTVRFVELVPFVDAITFGIVMWNVGVTYFDCVPEPDVGAGVGVATLPLLPPVGMLVVPPPPPPQAVSARMAPSAKYFRM
jgi:hypothetical protein